MFLFDNDPAGRSSLEALAGKGSNISGSAVKIGDGNLSAAVLPYQTQLFREFMAECSLNEGEIKFPFELLFVNSEMLRFIEESTLEDKDWLSHLHHDYYREKPQHFTNRLREFKRGTPGWLYARMVPNRLKEKFINEALKSVDKDCNALRRLVQTVSETLQLPYCP